MSNGADLKIVEFTRSTALSHLEARRSSTENSCYRPHAHAGFSIGLIEAGTSAFAGPIGGSVQLHVGDVILIGADQVHQCSPENSNWQYQMIHMDHAWAERVAGETVPDRLFSGVTVLRRSDLGRRVTQWGDLIFADAEETTISTSLRALLGELGEVTPDHVVTNTRDDTLRETLRPVLDRLQHDAANPSLDALGSLVGMTRFELVRTVKLATGLPPLAWRQNARIIRARELLRSGQSIADTAHALGFADQSHFHRVFRAHVAASPGAYRG